MSILDWKRVHHEAIIIDMHIHLSMQQQLFNRNPNMRYVINRTLHGNPMSVRATFPRLRVSGYDVICSTLYVPEHGILRDFLIVKLFRFLRPDLWRKLVVSPPFDATLRIMQDMELAVASSASTDAVKMAHSIHATRS